MPNAAIEGAEKNGAVHRSSPCGLDRRFPSKRCSSMRRLRARAIFSVRHDDKSRAQCNDRRSKPRLTDRYRNGVFGRTASPAIHPLMSIAFIFPGQGSQAVGMGAELAKAYPSARAVFEEIDAALSQNLSRCDVGGAGKRADAHRERATGAYGGLSRGDARARREGPESSRQSRLCGGAFAWRIFGACRLGRSQPCRYGTAAQDARPRHAGGRARWRGSDGGACSAPISPKPSSSRRQRPRAKCARPPTTMRRGRS